MLKNLIAINILNQNDISQIMKLKWLVSMYLCMHKEKLIKTRLKHLRLKKLNYWNTYFCLRFLIYSMLLCLAIHWSLIIFLKILFPPSRGHIGMSVWNSSSSCHIKFIRFQCWCNFSWYTIGTAQLHSEHKSFLIVL